MHRRHAGRGPVASLTTGLAVIAVAAATAAAAPAAAVPAWTGTVISMASGPYGQMLVVGSGTYKGFTLYAITSDRRGHYGCTTTVLTVLGHHGTCTGPSGDTSAEWPAITTSGQPQAGNGVEAGLLGSVWRKHVGHQITYAGHPLYLFDPKAGDVFGEGWDEPGLPPWHGVWWVVSPSGRYQPWAGLLTTVQIGSRRVLAARMQTAIGFKAFPVYTYSNDSLTRSACNLGCARAWPPLLTSGSPALARGVYRRYVADIFRADGNRQVEYDGQPLYLYGFERIVHSGKGYVAAGNGNGKSLNGGTFSLVSP